MKGNPFDFHNWKRAAFAVALFWSAAGACAQTPGSVDATFSDPFVQSAGPVHSVAMQMDGKVLIGGEFTSVNGVARNHIARLNADGSLDTGFAPSMGANSYVYSVAVQGDGKVLIGGEFTSVNGVARNYIARLNADGSLDTGFDPGTGANDGGVAAVVVQSDDKVLIGGGFTSVNGVARNHIARLNADGSLDTGFDPGTGANGSVESVALQSDGRVLIVGFFMSVNGVARNYIARLNADGSLDTGFAPSTGSNSYVYSVAVQSDGKVVIGGNFTSVNGVARNYIARLTADGSLDTGFDPGTGTNNSVLSVAVQSDGQVLIGGYFTSFDGVARIFIARLNANGILDTGFDPGAGANSYADSVAVQPDGKALIGGYFTSVDGVAGSGITRLNSDGSPDTAFDPSANTNGYVLSVALQADGKIVLGGHFTSVGGVLRNNIARLNADGSADMGLIRARAPAIMWTPWRYKRTAKSC